MRETDQDLIFSPEKFLFSGFSTRQVITQEIIEIVPVNANSTHSSSEGEISTRLRGESPSKTSVCKSVATPPVADPSRVTFYIVTAIQDTSPIHAQVMPWALSAFTSRLSALHYSAPFCSVSITQCVFCQTPVCAGVRGITTAPPTDRFPGVWQGWQGRWPCRESVAAGKL
ncbi:hypothetical protein ATHL_01179 [Anaerolinea thermolimosa]|nr:hypothetical protein ATHL_01179 [Anaerolinea thermolimosa]